MRAALKLVMSPMERTDFWTVYRQYRACRRCPIFYHPLRTCGSPLDKDFRGLGCYCSMEKKVGIKSATCWGDDNLGNDFEFGWNKRKQIYGKNNPCRAGQKA
jgi:hypothetical protein